MLVNDDLYFHTFCKLLEAVVEAGGLEIPIERLQNYHFCLLSRKVNVKSGAEFGVQPATFRDYRYIYKREKKFSVRQNRLDVLCVFLGYDGWSDFRKSHFQDDTPAEQSDPTIRLLVLPDKRFGVANRFEGQIAELVLNRYEELKYDLNIDNLEIIYKHDLVNTPSGCDKIRELGLANKADLVVWPEYLHGEKPMMRIQSLLVNPDKEEYRCKKKRYQPVETLADIQDGAFLEDTDIMLFSLLGNLAFENKEEYKAKSYYQEVLALNPDHTTANNIIEKLQPIQKNNDQKVANPELIEFVKEDSLTQEAEDLDNHLLVLKGDNRVLKTKDLEPLVRSELIHEDEPVIFLTKHTDLALMSMNDLNVFHVAAKKEEIPIKKTLVTLDEWNKDEEKNEKHHQSRKWLLIHSSQSVELNNEFTDELKGILIFQGKSMVSTKQDNTQMLPKSRPATP